MDNWKYIHVTPMDTIENWLLEDDLVYPLIDNAYEIIKIKSGFITDLASIPRIFWNIYPPYDPSYRSAAIIHDGLYGSHMFDRKRCDDILFQAMKQLGCSFYKRNLIYYNVRMFGGTAWNSKTKESMLDARQYVSYIGDKEKVLEIK